MAETENNEIRLAVPLGHYYSPIVNPAEARAHYAALAASPEPIELPGIEISLARHDAMWATLLPYYQTAPFTNSKQDQYRYCYGNAFYSVGDGSTLHAMIRHCRPRRIIEIGSGWSSACMLDTADRYLSSECQFTFIEPFAGRLRDVIGSYGANIDILECPVHKVPLALFEGMQENDILFIDSTHVLKTASDVCFELFEILPRLKRGILVNFHDIFWPFEYPRHWILDWCYLWNELYAVRAFLTNNSNDYYHKMRRAHVAMTFPKFLENAGGALWLRKL